MDKERRDYPDIAPVNRDTARYARAVRVGDWLLIAGCTAGGTPAQNGSMAEQVRATLERIKRIIEREGGAMTDAVRFTTYVTSIEAWRAGGEAINAAFTEYFGDQYPANSLIGTTELAMPEMLVEIEATVAL